MWSQAQWPVYLEALVEPLSALAAAVGLGACAAAFRLTKALGSGRASCPAGPAHAGAGGCAHVLAVPQARLFGLPNYWLGCAYYAAMLALRLPGWSLSRPVLWGVAAAAGAAFGVSAYLTVQLVRVLRMPCPLCFVAHGANAALALLAAASVALP
ncbi:MAG TPA: vitamin K epoxide reductase family protein [Limnochordales bacterium]